VPNIRWLLALVTAVHRFLFRATGGRIGAQIGKVDVLLLTTTGRKSGKRRVTPLLFVEDEGRWVVVASNAGDDRHPSWWLNLQANPDSEVQVRDQHHKTRARRARPEEAEALWPRLDRAYPPYADYRRRTSREIPVVILDPT
jgi:deazaflavin-dependent oxidoreductase (nitroreductase family)